jgi:hypothetical protein
MHSSRREHQRVATFHEVHQDIGTLVSLDEQQKTLRLSASLLKEIAANTEGFSITPSYFDCGCAGAAVVAGAVGAAGVAGAVGAAGAAGFAGVAVASGVAGVACIVPG